VDECGLCGVHCNMLGHEWAVCDRGVWFKSCKHLVIWGEGESRDNYVSIFFPKPSPLSPVLVLVLLSNTL
jgi:hypothetical protein